MSDVLGSIAGLSFSLALVAIAGAGLATIVGFRPLQEWFGRAAVVTIALGLALPIAQGAVARLGHGVFASTKESTALPGGFWIFVLVLVGHVALMVILWRRRRGASGRGRNVQTDELNQVRGRRRARLSLDGEER
jgi:hypothetical protein